MYSNKTPKNILFAVSEAVPYVKTGGLADVAGALPKALSKLGHDIRLVLPRYWAISHEHYGLQRCIAPMGVQMGTCVVWCSVFEGRLENIPVYFIEHEEYFGRSGIYDDGTHEYHDNPARFGFFARACIQLCQDLQFQPDVIHCNDWQTALIPAYLKLWEKYNPFFHNTATVFSIHNIGYQGKFSKDYYSFLGLGWEHFTDDKFECHQHIHFMKGGIFYADAITTVSPNYAQEILTSMGSNGIAQYLERRREDLYGILNGADYDHWNPEIDPLLPAQYSVNDLEGKKICKYILQHQFHLDDNPAIPIIGIVSRLTHQKGLHLLMDIIERIVSRMAVQFAIVGKGEKSMEDFFGGLPARYGGKIGTWIGYTEQKGHIVEAGADFFLMPSIYEPCGLNQMYSLKYGTIPIVRDTGGLHDTIIPYNEKEGTGTGFMFHAINAEVLYNTISLAVSTYFDRPKHIRAMRKAGMQKHFSWLDSAQHYERVYENALDRKLQWK